MKAVFSVNQTWLIITLRISLIRIHSVCFDKGIILECICIYLEDNCIQNFHLGRYTVGYMVGNLVLRQRESGAVKRDFRTYIGRYTSPNENFEYGYLHSNAHLQFHPELELSKPHKAAHHPTRCDVI